jgi:hypothetical protein
MQLCFSRRFAGVSWLIAVAFGCSVDGRALSWEARALDVAGSPPSNGGAFGAEGGAPESSDNAGAPGDAGAPSSTGGHAGAMGTAGTANDGGNSGGASNSGASNSGASNGGATNGGATNGGASGAQGTGASGTVTGGQGGSVFNGPCGDLNHDLIDDCSQTLVQNSRFDSSLSNWDAEPSLTVTWDASNASGKPGSGSLSLVHNGAGGTMIGARQCIPVTADTTYDVAARVMLAAGQPGGTGAVNVYLFDDGACQGNIITGKTPIEGGEAGKWLDLLGSLWVPGSAHSMYVRLVANKPLNQPSLTVLIDDVLVAKH